MADWYYSTGGSERAGPVSVDDLRNAIASGALAPQVLVWTEGMAQWQTAREIPALVTTVASAGSQYAQPQQYAAASEYAQPQYAQAIGYESPSSGSVVATERVLQLLQQTKPWVRFMSVMAFIGAGLMIVVGFFVLVAGGIAASSYRSSNQPPLMLLSLVYFVLGGVYIAPAVFLGRFASRIGTLLKMRRSVDLEAAMEAQKSFWRFMGIMTITVIVLYFVGIAIAVVFGVMR